MLPLAEGPEQSLTPAAERRLTVYRLYLTVLMTVEVVPRRYDHPGLADELARLVHNRAVLLDRAP
ncbi:hypothetical protein [Cellulomonas sp. KRMCY2]|uniref:hypothetical protein n=1 Tax=Cellulomonas sp. KRMCY2 TaxID=1304865 RepID=UPI00045E7581|nr:hypothetical protein [Cellulomonas sp. KRMCY2]